MKQEKPKTDKTMTCNLFISLSKSEASIRRYIDIVQKKYLNDTFIVAVLDPDGINLPSSFKIILACDSAQMRSAIQCTSQVFIEDTFSFLSKDFEPYIEIFCLEALALRDERRINALLGYQINLSTEKIKKNNVHFPWKLKQIYKRVRRILFPENSRREKVYTVFRRKLNYFYYHRPNLHTILSIKALPKLIKTRGIFPDWWSYPNNTDVEDAMHRAQKLLAIKPDASVQVVIFSGVPYSLAEGQRSTWLAREWIKKGVKVIFAYYRFTFTEIPIQDPEEPDLCIIPLDQLWQTPDRIFGVPCSEHTKRFFVMEFPHPALFRLINLAKCQGWKTIYEKIDDWQEFQKKGQASWYDPQLEHYLMVNADFLCATAETLVEEMQSIAKRKVTLLPNAFDSSSFAGPIKPLNIPQGEITIGYFGHLTSSWFDWSLLISTAKRHPTWQFHVLGYGFDVNKNLPKNILLPGKIPHTELQNFAAMWDVAIIPFTKSKLAGAVNPVKLYEYLALHIPVVTSGMPHLRNFPYVLNASSQSEFEQMIISASQTLMDIKIVDEFLAENTWSHRSKSLLNLESTRENYS